MARIALGNLWQRAPKSLSGPGPRSRVNFRNAIKKDKYWVGIHSSNILDVAGPRSDNSVVITLLKGAHHEGRSRNYHYRVAGVWFPRVDEPYVGSVMLWWRAGPNGNMRRG